MKTVFITFILLLALREIYTQNFWNKMNGTFCGGALCAAFDGNCVNLKPLLDKSDFTLEIIWNPKK